MKTLYRAALGVACTFACIPVAVQAQEAEENDTTQDRVLTDFILVSGARPDAIDTDELEPPRLVALPADTAAIAARIAGGALIGNGDELPESHLAPPKIWEADYTPNATGTDRRYLPAGALERGGRRASATGDYEAWTPDA